MSKKVWLAFSIVIFLPINMFADTFEFVTFTPPTGWTKEVMNDAVVYKRATGIGAISLYNGYPTSGTAAEEFAKIWSVRIGGIVRGPGPEPKIERDGEFTVAVGARQVNAQDALVSITLVTFVGRGRTFGITTLSSGDDVLREVTTFLDSIKIGAAPAAATNSEAIDVDFTPPPGYTSQRDGRAIVLKPVTLDAKTPCIYGISPSRPSSGNLERDARAALLEPLAGWQVKGEQYNAERGTAGAGWPYYWFRTDVQQMSGGTMQYLNAMSMAFSGASGQTNIVWGFGPTQHCTLDDVPFLRLFHSLKPRGFVSDGGKAIKQQLVGTWRNTEAVGMAQYIFTSRGVYEYGQGTSTTFSTLETTTGSVGDGKYSLNGSEITLTGRRAGRHFVRIYDEYSGGIWLKTMSLLNDASGLEVRYMRVKD